MTPCKYLIIYMKILQIYICVIMASCRDSFLQYSARWMQNFKTRGILCLILVAYNIRSKEYIDG